MRTHEQLAKQWRKDANILERRRGKCGHVMIMADVAEWMDDCGLAWEEGLLEKLKESENATPNP